MEPRLIRQITVVESLEVPADFPALDDALKKYGCPLSHMRIAPAEDVCLVRIDGEAQIVRKVALNGHHPEWLSEDDMREKIAEALGVGAWQLRDEFKKDAELRKQRQQKRERQMA